MKIGWQLRQTKLKQKSDGGRDGIHPTLSTTPTQGQIGRRWITQMTGDETNCEVKLTRFITETRKSR